MQAVLLPVGTELYAVPMEWVREVVADPSLTPLATAPPIVLGLFNLRGQIVPLIDTAALLGVGTVGTVATATFAAVIQTQYGLVAFAATALPEPVLLAASIGPSELPGTRGMYRLGHRVAVLLDLASLLTPDHLGVSRRDDPLPAGIG